MPHKPKPLPTDDQQAADLVGVLERIAGGKRRRVLTRDDLLHRYASATGMTYGEAHDRHAETEIESLRSTVESAEAMRRGPYAGERAAFARSQPTTSLKGHTR